MEILWKIENLKKIYEVKSEFAKKKVVAIDGVSFEIYKGETFGIIGESGSGKTTLGKTIIRLIEPTEGKIFFRNTDISEMKETHLRPLRKKFQIIFQDPYKSLNPRINALRTVMEGMDEKLKMKEKREKAEYLLSLVGIKKERINNFPHQFSGGERQRIAIARALSTDPEFIVCDEPTSNLDLSIQAQILNLFLELREKLNLTYLFITHDIKVMKYISDRVGVMYKGKIVEIGKTEKVINSPSHPYTEKLISSELKIHQIP